MARDQSVPQGACTGRCLAQRFRCVRLAPYPAGYSPATSPSVGERLARGGKTHVCSWLIVLRCGSVEVGGQEEAAAAPTRDGVQVAGGRGSRPSGKRELAGLFRVLDHVIRETRNALLIEQPVSSDAARFDCAVLGRALHILEATQLLLPVAHWEAASGLARQLFELLVNVEEIGRQDDPAEARLRYGKFGLLQHVRERLRRVEYDRESGRPVNEVFADELDQLLSSPDFAGFRKPNGWWRGYWSGKSVRVLASESKSEIRPHQYEQVFRRWSEEAHAAPSTIIRAMFRGWSQESWIDDMLEEDQKEIGEVLTMTVLLFLELEAALPYAPHLSWEQKRVWTDALMDDARRRGWAPPGV
jgi:hypothetical protein